METKFVEQRGEGLGRHGLIGEGAGRALPPNATSSSSNLESSHLWTSMKPDSSSVFRCWMIVFSCCKATFLAVNSAISRRYSHSLSTQISFQLVKGIRFLEPFPSCASLQSTLRWAGRVTYSYYYSVFEPTSPFLLGSPGSPGFPASTLRTLWGTLHLILVFGLGNSGGRQICEDRESPTISQASRMSSM